MFVETITRSFFRKPKRRVVYTCMFGYSEALNDFPIDADPGTDLLCFTDDPQLKSSVWRIVYAPYPMLDPVRAAKRIKILPHRFLSEYESSLYIDNTVRLKRPVADIFEEYLDRSASPFVCFNHPWRNCIFDEADELIKIGFDDPHRIRAQMEFYRLLGIPKQIGLFKGAFLLRRHNDAELSSVMECWFEQLLKYSFRDQLSLPVVMRWMNFSCGIITHDFLKSDVLDWPLVTGERLPRDFDDVRYLRLHPDVHAEGVNPRRHYMAFGRSEGRRYK